MAISAAYSVANFAEKRNPPRLIMPTWTRRVFAQEAADVAMTAIKTAWRGGSSTTPRVYKKRSRTSRGARRHRRPDEERFHQGAGVEMLEAAVQKAVDAVKK